jgi:hypothetical protein
MFRLVRCPVARYGPLLCFSSRSCSASAILGLPGVEETEDAKENAEEGPLSAAPAIASILLGSMAGMYDY